MENDVIDLFMKSIEDIRFEDIGDLFKRKNYIRKKYQMLERNYREMYKWYFFYQLCIIKKLEVKRVFWYYLNSDGNDTELNRNVMLEYYKFERAKENSKYE